MGYEMHWFSFRWTRVRLSARLCGKNNSSLFRKMPVTELGNFQWERLMSDLQTRALILLQNDHRWKRTGSAPSTYMYICVVMAFMLKEYNRDMCGE